MIFLGIDWAEAHHEFCLLSETGGVLARGRVPDGVEGVAQLHEMVAEHASGPEEIVVGIELDRGLLVGALAASGYQLYAINPLSVDRYRDRHRVSGAKSDPGDAKVLAEIVRTDLTTTDRSPATRRWPRRSRSSPPRTSAPRW